MLSNLVFAPTSPDGSIQFKWTAREIGNLGRRALSKIAAKKVAMLQLLSVHSSLLATVIRISL